MNMKVNAKSEFVSLSFFLLFSLFLLCEFIARHSGKTAKAKGKKFIIIAHHHSRSRGEQSGGEAVSRRGTLRHISSQRCDPPFV